jgi:hypothetical protein
MKQFQDRQGQRALAATALPDESKDFLRANVERKLAQYPGLPRIVDRESQGQQRLRIHQRFLATSLLNES